MSNPMLPVQILLVEDTADFAKMMLDVLRHYGIHADLAATADQATAYLNEHKPDLMLLDLNLGGTNGWKVMDFVKQKYGQHGVPVVITSAQSDQANRMIGRLQYVRHYLVKPFTPRELYQVIDDVLELYKLEAQSS